MTAPIACDGFTVEMPLITLGLWLDGSIVSPIAGPARDSRLYIAPRSADCGAAANVAHAFAMAIGMCLMNGYSVVKGHLCLPKRKTGREFSYLSTCFLT